MLKKLASIILITTFLTSCSTDIDINAEWKEIMIVYGLLDHNDTTHYVRVQKAYLGEGNVLTMASVSDSIYYSDSIYVELQAMNGNQNNGSPIVLEPTFIAKEDGVFASDGHYVFKTPASFNQNLDQSLNYKVLVRNVNSANEATSITNLIGNYNVTVPQTPSINLNADSEFTIEWTVADNASVYQPIVRFHYFEDGVNKYVDMELSSIRNENNLSKLNKSFERTTIYSFIGNAIEASETAVRIPLGLEVIILAGGEEYDLYTQVNGPSSSIVEEQPEYTNIENGLGLFSCRTSTSSVENFTTLANPSGYYQFSSASIDSLKCGSKTGDLHFASLVENLVTNQVDTVFCNN